MIFNIEKLILKVHEYLEIDRNAMFEAVKEHDPYNEDGEYCYDIGIANMNDNGVCVIDGEELKGRIEAFETILDMIARTAKEKNGQEMQDCSMIP